MLVILVRREASQALCPGGRYYHQFDFQALLQVGLSREAPAIFKYGDIYLMITSGCTGWQVNRAEVFFARHDLLNQPQRPYAQLRNP